MHSIPLSHLELHALAVSLLITETVLLDANLSLKILTFSGEVIVVSHSNVAGEVLHFSCLGVHYRVSILPN